MQLNRKNILKILFIIFVSIVMLVVLQNMEQTLGVLGQLLQVLSPFILGICMAFIINVPLKFLEEHVFVTRGKIKKPLLGKFQRPVSILVSILLILSILVAVLLVIIPEIKNTIVTLTQDLPARAEAIATSLTNWLTERGISMQILTQLEIDWNSISSNIAKKFAATGSTVINTTIGLTSDFFKIIFNFVMGFAFAMYLLASKEKLQTQVKKVMYSLFPKEPVSKSVEVLGLANNLFSKFVKGQCTEAVILGVLCYIGMAIIKMPYAVAISSMIGITALIPVFGAFIGTAVGALMILIESPMLAVWFVVYIVVLQQFESNVIYPRVVGSSVGLPGIWVLASVSVGGSLFGIFGMLVSVPVCAVLYCLLRQFVEKRLDQRKVDSTLYQ